MNQEIQIESTETSCKATAILAGLLKEQVMQKQATGTMIDTVQALTHLLAGVTSTDAVIRRTAKKRIRTLAAEGGWFHVRAKREGTEFTMPVEDSAEPAPAIKKKSGTWSDADKELVRSRWASSMKDAAVIHQLRVESGRTPLAIIIRLYQEDLILLDEGDRLCLACGASRLLSEANVFGTEREVRP
jgi:hypothetical protein